MMIGLKQKMKSSARTIQITNSLVTRLREKARKHNLPVPELASGATDTIEGASVLLLLCIIRSLGNPIPAIVAANTNKNNKWNSVCTAFDVDSACMFLYHELCRSDAQYVQHAVDIFSKNATFNHSSRPPVADLIKISTIMSMTNPLNRHNSFTKFYVISLNGKRSHHAYNIVGEYLGVLCAVGFYSVHIATEQVDMPAWLVDCLICVRGYAAVCANWSKWFPMARLPDIELKLRQHCPGIPDSITKEVVTRMATVVLPYTYLTYSALPKKSDSTAAQNGHGLRSHGRAHGDPLLFPKMHDDSASLVAAVYATCGEIHRTCPESTSTDQLYSYARFCICNNWEGEKEEKYNTEEYHKVDTMIGKELRSWKKKGTLYWLREAFGNIASVIRRHCVKDEYAKDTHIWNNSVTGLQMKHMSRAAVEQELVQHRMVFELSQFSNMQEGFSFLLFDTTDNGKHGITLQAGKQKISSRTRATELNSSKSCMDVAMAMWWHTQCAQQYTNVRDFNLMRINMNRGILAIPTEDWEINMRGVQWSISLCTRIQLTKRCPAYMAVVNMLLHPRDELARWALVAINTMLTGLLPFSNGSGVTAIPAANTAAFRRCITHMFQIVTSCALSKEHGGIASIVRNSMCGTGTMLGALRCLLQYNDCARWMTFKSYLALMQYMERDENGRRMAEMLQQHGTDVDNYQYSLLRDMVCGIDADTMEERDVNISQFVHVVYLICANTDYIDDIDVGLRVFEGIYVPTQRKKPAPAPRSAQMWDAMVEIINSNLFYNYFVIRPEHPVAVNATGSITLPVARVPPDEPDYETTQYLKNTDVVTLATLVYLLEQDQYLQYPSEKRERDSQDEEEHENGHEVVIGYLDDSRSEDSQTLSNFSMSGKKGARKARRLVCPEDVIGNSEMSRSSFYEFDIKKTARTIQTGKKEGLGMDCPLFPYLNAQTYVARLNELPLCLDSSNCVVYERNGLLLPTLPLALAPEETRERVDACGVGPVSGAPLPFLYSVLCTRIAMEDAVRVV